MFFALLKVHHGLRHLTSWWPTEPSLLSMTDECLLRGKLLMRPYLLGQDTDVCSAACVFTLLHDYCESAGIDATQLLARAYPNQGPYDRWTAQIWQDIRTDAVWQGVSIPRRWTTDGLIGLSLSLTASHHDALSDVLLAAVASSRKPRGSNGADPLG